MGDSYDLSSIGVCTDTVKITSYGNLMIIYKFILKNMLKCVKVYTVS